MKKILPILLVVLGIVGGGAAGMFLKPAPEPSEEAEESGAAASSEDKDDNAGENGAKADYAGDGDSGGDGHTVADGDSTDGEVPVGRSYVKVGRQTIVPIVDGGKTEALMMFELAVDVPVERTDDVHAIEPRLRDAFLRELMQMSHTGAFMETFTDDRIIQELRRNLVKAARTYLGPEVGDVLILDVMRQEMP